MRGHLHLWRLDTVLGNLLQLRLLEQGGVDEMISGSLPTYSMILLH